MSEEVDFLRSIKRSLRTIAISTVVLYLCLAVVGIVGWTIRVHDLQRVNAVAEQSQTALCAFRDNLEKQVSTSEAFLAENPDGIPGLPANTIQSSIDRQKDTLVALDILDC